MLNSTLIKMVKEAAEAGKLLSLESLSWKKEWSAFLQYLAHTYRQIGDHEQFALEVEQVLRGTLGFQEIRQSHPAMAIQFVAGVRQYGRRLAGQPLSLVDHTGFSLETVLGILGRPRSSTCPVSAARRSVPLRSAHYTQAARWSRWRTPSVSWKP